MTNCNSFFAPNMHERAFLYVFVTCVNIASAPDQDIHRGVHKLQDVDERWGEPVDNVDKSVNIRKMPAFFSCCYVDNLVETVDESTFGCAYPVFSIVHIPFKCPIIAV